MRRPIHIMTAVLLALLAAAAAGGAAEEKAAEGAGPAAESGGPSLRVKVPLFSERFSVLPVATVNDDDITIDELAAAVAAMHEEQKDGAAAPRISYDEILRRLINTLLFVQEAKNMGLDEVPEIRNILDTFAKTTLRQFLMREVTKDTKPDEELVERYYRDAVRQWNIRSLLFDKEEDALALVKRIKAGEDFAALVQEAVQAGIAKGSGKEDVVNPASLLPKVQETVAKLKPGELSPVVKLVQGKREGYTIIRLEGEVYPEDPAARNTARARALSDGKKKTGLLYRKELYRKHVVIQRQLLSSLDYEKSLKRIDGMLKDKRTIARINGEKPITVGDLTEALKAHFYHGMDIAAEGKKLNRKKQEVLEQIIDKRILEKEARKRGIDRLPAYQRAVKDHETSVLFGALVQKVIAPDVKVSDDEAQKAYREHAGEYVTPEMMRISAIAFGDAAAAEDARKKLKKGADFRWVAENAEGRLPENTAGLLQFPETPLTVNGLPEDIRRAVSGARTGDHRVANDEQGRYYVLHVSDVIPSRQLPYEEVRDQVTKKTASQKLGSEAETWVGKLREAARITVYLDQVETRVAAARGTE